MTIVRVFMVDDHPTFRFGVQALLLATPDLEFAGEASTGAEAIPLVLADPPDVVLMDLNMPDMNGVDATRLLIEHLPSLAVLVLTMAEDDAAVVAAIGAGASGYIVKGSTSEQIIRAIRSAADGQAIFSAQIASRLPGSFGAPRHPAPQDGSIALETLTPREREILHLIAAGLTNAAIADQLYLSPKTVGNRVGDIFGKIGAANRNEAIVVARDAGLGRAQKTTLG